METVPSQGMQARNNQTGSTLSDRDYIKIEKLQTKDKNSRAECL